MPYHIPSGWNLFEKEETGHQLNLPSTYSVPQYVCSLRARRKLNNLAVDD